MITNEIAALKNVENFILGDTSYSPISLGHNLQQLRTSRESLYKKAFEEAKLNEQTKIALMNEYDSYCGFYRTVICSKKLSNAIFGRLLQTFLNDYNLIKPLDNDKTAYAMTLSTLNNIKSFLEKSDYVTRNYRLRGISKLSQRFIDENKKQKELAL